MDTAVRWLHRGCLFVFVCEFQPQWSVFGPQWALDSLIPDFVDICSLRGTKAKELSAVLLEQRDMAAFLL